MRLDYAVVNTPLSESCAVSSWITRDAETERLSFLLSGSGLYDYLFTDFSR
jgi:hypothetical protein